MDAARWQDLIRRRVQRALPGRWFVWNEQVARVTNRHFAWVIVRQPGGNKGFYVTATIVPLFDDLAGKPVGFSRRLDVRGPDYPGTFFDGAEISRWEADEDLFVLTVGKLILDHAVPFFTRYGSDLSGFLKGLAERHTLHQPDGLGDAGSRMHSAQAHLLRGDLRAARDHLARVAAADAAQPPRRRVPARVKQARRLLASGDNQLLAHAKKLAHSENARRVRLGLPAPDSLPSIPATFFRERRSARELRGAEKEDQRARAQVFRKVMEYAAQTPSAHTKGSALGRTTAWGGKELWIEDCYAVVVQLQQARLKHAIETRARWQDAIRALLPVDEDKGLECQLWWRVPDRAACRRLERRELWPHLRKLLQVDFSAEERQAAVVELWECVVSLRTAWLLRSPERWDVKAAIAFDEMTRVALAGLPSAASR